MKYSSDSEIYRVNFPSGWSAEDLTEMSLNIYDSAGEALLEDSAFTLYTATTLDGAVSRYEDSLTLDSEAGDLAPGDRIMIVGTGVSEIRTVKGYDSTNRIVTLETTVDNQYDDGDSVYALHATADLDLSDTDVFEQGAVLTIEVIPVGTGAPFTERATLLAYQQLDTEGFSRDMEALYPRAYSALTSPANRFEAVLNSVREKLRKDMLLQSGRFNINTIRDSSVLGPALMALCAFNWTLNGDDGLADERKAYQNEYEAEKRVLASLPIWADSDEDLIEDDEETTSHPHIFLPGW